MEYIAHETVMPETVFKAGDTLLYRGGPVNVWKGKKLLRVDRVPDQRVVFTKDCTQETMKYGENFTDTQPDPLKRLFEVRWCQRCMQDLNPDLSGHTPECKLRDVRIGPDGTLHVIEPQDPIDTTRNDLYGHTLRKPEGDAA